tara:strand:+ start:123 stop:599 length:477 start_codon:yes stop_codon:yes gene_type:complete
MKRTLTMLSVVLVVGCGDNAEATENRAVVEIESTDKVIVVPNTEHINYNAYRLEWRRVNDKPAPRWAPDVTLTTRTHKDPEDSHEVVELHLNDLSFKEAFSIEFRGKGEGHTFWWRGAEYTTNLLDVIRKPDFKQTDPYIERIPVKTEDVNDQGTTEE